MKILQVFVLCLWLRSSTAGKVLPFCACAKTPTILITSSGKPVDVLWPGKCLRVVDIGYTKCRLVKGNMYLLALTKSLELKLCFGQVTYGSGGDCPRIISRNEWGARKPNKRKNLSTPVTYAVVHHSDTPPCSTKALCIKRIQSIQNYHMNVKHWDDIGYNFLIGGDGNVYEGRGWDTVGAHAIGYNQVSIGICVIGNYMKVVPNAASLASLKRMLGCLDYKHKVKSNYRLRGHRDLGNTNCPGDKLYDIIRHWPHY